MELYIQVDENRNPVNHPILGDNLRDALGVDTNNLPPQYARFVRIPRPNADPGKYIVSAELAYAWDGDVIKDVWTIVQEDIPVEIPQEE